MSLNKAIEHGKEKRKPYRGSKAIDCTCRNHGTCEWCKRNRLYKFRDKHPQNWRDDPITEKQEILIAQIEEDACMNNAIIPPFQGKTKGEASDWISAYNGLQFYSAFCPHEDAGDRV